ncbi:parafibromin-like [Drosophila guanche]|uniref:Blast:Parafibromin n=1 Tax=Drosophila guanche TaxID=7266 RepID=A0A3B0KJ35_DROGU|nr:parafibromin-like [Drosophila guanche]SPP88550.1 blast:Parafibromin [Drosophila guanche]
MENPGRKVKRKEETADCADSQPLAENLMQREAIKTPEEHKARSPFPPLAENEAAAAGAAEAASSENSDVDPLSNIPYLRLCTASSFLKRKAATPTERKSVPKTPRANGADQIAGLCGRDMPSLGTNSSSSFSSSSSSYTSSSTSSPTSSSEEKLHSSSVDTETTTDSPQTPEPEAEQETAAAPITFLPKYNRYEQEKFLQPLSTQTNFVIDPLGTHFPEGPYRLQSLEQVPPPMRLPIIVLPADPHGLITLKNVKALLVDLKFQQSEERPCPWAPVEQHREEVIIERWFAGGVSRKYKVIDDVAKLASFDEWRRIVAVFACGPIDQFKNWWPWKRNAKLIFLNVCAFHLYVKGTAVHRDIAQMLDTMEVNPLEIDLPEPYTHSGTLLSFWGRLDKFVHSNARFRFLLDDYYPANTYY